MTPLLQLFNVQKEVAVTTFPGQDGSLSHHSSQSVLNDMDKDVLDGISYPVISIPVNVKYTSLDSYHRKIPTSTKNPIITKSTMTNIALSFSTDSHITDYYS